MNSLARARRFLGYTQAQMADHMGVSRHTWLRREKLAEEYVPKEALMACAWLLDANTEVLVDWMEGQIDHKREEPHG